MRVEGSGAQRPSMAQVVREVTEMLGTELRSKATPSLNEVPNPMLYGSVTAFFSRGNPIGRRPVNSGSKRMIVLHLKYT